MVKKSKGKHRLDKFYHLAKEQGYRSRAAFKLIQLNRKYNFLENCTALLDLCAAPGGWLQVAAKAMPIASVIIGADLVPIKPIRGVKTIVGDITTQECRAAIRKEAAGNSMNVVLHDGAPNVGGAWSNEMYTQSSLVLDALRMATELLAPKGTFVTKIFRSKDYTALLYALNALFDRVEATKPAASRNTSAEIFVVCLGYKAPSRIDPRLLDTRVLFQEVAEPKKSMGPEALLRQRIKQKRHREGYDEGLSTLHKGTSVLSFLLSDTPVEMLGQYTQLLLDGPGSTQGGEEKGVPDPAGLVAAMRSHPATTSEIRELCNDLQVLGRSEFKALLKWRLMLVKALKEQMGVAGAVTKQKDKKDKKGATAEEDGEKEEEDPEEALMSEMQSIRERMASERKRDKRKHREMRIKARIRQAQAASGEGMEDVGRESDGVMFSLAGLGGRAVALGEAEAPDEDLVEEVERGSEDEEADVAYEEGSSCDEEERRQRYEEELEEALESSYKEYLARKGQREEVLKEKRRRLGMDGELDDEDTKVAKPESDDEDDDEEAEEDDGDGGLIVELDEDRAGVALSGHAMAAQWFSQDLFNDPNLLEEGEATSSGKQAPAPSAAKSKQSKQALANDITASEAKAGAKGAKAKKSSTLKGKEKPESVAEASTAAGRKLDEDQEDDEVEIVPIEKDRDGSESDSEDEFDMLDDHGKAEVLALAKKMLRRRDREDIMDAAYNRFAFHDDHLPKWLRDDEDRHLRPIPMVTRDEVEAEKARLKSIDTRPIKKVAEAKARKRKRLMVRLDNAKAKAEVVANQEDVPATSKIREIEKIYSAARGGKKGGRGGKRDKRRGPPLDRRMLKDKRGALKASRGGKGGRKGRGGGVRKGRR